MAQPLVSFKIIEVRTPKVGDIKPAAVTAEVVLDISKLRPDVRREWDQLKQHDVLFLMTIRPPAEGAAAVTGAGAVNAAEQYGLTYVRGCEVIEVRQLQKTFGIMHM